MGVDNDNASEWNHSPARGKLCAGHWELKRVRSGMTLGEAEIGFSGGRWI